MSTCAAILAVLILLALMAIYLKRRKRLMVFDRPNNGSQESRSTTASKEPLAEPATPTNTTEDRGVDTNADDAPQQAQEADERSVERGWEETAREIRASQGEQYEYQQTRSEEEVQRQAAHDTAVRPISRMVSQFLAAMKAAGNPGTVRQGMFKPAIWYLGIHSSGKLTVRTDGTWEYTKHHQDLQGITSFSRTKPISGLSAGQMHSAYEPHVNAIRRLLTESLLEHNVPLPRD